MDCIGFHQSSFTHTFINPKPSNFTFNNAPFIYRHNRSINNALKLTSTCCCAVGLSSGESSSSPSINFATVEAEITQETIDFFSSDAEGDPDRPSPGYSSIEQALVALRQENFVIVVDDGESDDDNVEGSLVMAASHVSSKAIAFMVKHGSGIVSVGMKDDDLERLKLPLMSPENDDGSSSAPSFTITVDAKVGTSTGVSASDRAKTVLALASSESRADDFVRPGHVFPLKYKNGGVLRRAGPTEASVDLVTLAGLRPVSVLSAVVDSEDGSIASMAVLRNLASEHSIPIVSITDLIRYRRKREKLVERSAISSMPTKWGLFQAHCYRSKLDGTENIAIVKDQGHDTVEANIELGFAADAREYGIGAQILHDIGVHTMRLMTNNPAKYTGLKGYGLAVVGRVPVLTPITEDNKRYLETKRTKMGHIYGSDLKIPITEFVRELPDL
ncbi:hypothetical protein MIMGU_mgv1a004646mg [Erythranthe guttata]|uniref:GTP cyclohydrolase II domain-containing protein n=1 Tax=Erythranthe guttata TaxID=4155 RepID=A0A022PXK1_ERYGU|nr:hypothetical protein MIMGU_mgv1a004646mg [Erythranthe guttata]